MKNQNKQQPPRWALRFLRWFCPADLLEGIEGDLLEDFATDSADTNPGVARRKLIIKAISFFRPGILFRNKISKNPFNMILLKSYFKISYRNLWRSKGYSFINILGLAIGIAACLLAFSYISFELSFDNFHPDVNRTYRVNETLIWSPQGGEFGSTGPALAPALEEGFPEIQEALRINTLYSNVIRYNDGKGKVSAFNEDNVLAADSDFFDFFGFKLKEGNPKTALKGINKIVISDVAEKKIFGDEPALGKVLLFGDARLPLVITGVTQHQPENAHFHFNYLLSIYSNPNIKKFEWSWIWTQVVTYVKLNPGADKAALEQKLMDLGKDRVRADCEAKGIDYDQITKGKGGWHFYLQPVRDIYLHSGNIGNRLGPDGDITYPLIFGIIGIFVLLIATINFINLSTARASKRAKEIGVKKTLGAMRNSLVWQFLAESIFIAILATFLAVLLTYGLQSLVNTTVNIHIPVNTLTTPSFLLALPLIPLVIGSLAGLYPSLYLTALKPINVLKGKLSSGTKNINLRNSLVTVQFIISIALIAGTLIVYKQVNFLNTKDIGFDKDNILVINHAERLGQHIESFRDELIKMPEVSDASIAMNVPDQVHYEDIWTIDGSSTKLPVDELKIDHHYFDLLGLKLVAGRFIDKNNPDDKMVAIPNETLVRMFGLTPDQALGRYIVYPGDDNARLEIIGVAKDFNFNSLRIPIAPLVFLPTGAKVWGDMRVIAIKFSTNSIQGLVNRIENKWNASVNATPMQYSFLDQDLAQQYEQENKMGSMLAILSGLSIIVALIGLIGLVSYSIEIRKKEIGIRKVFGASAAQILMMLNNQYVKLIAVALVLATPVAWWAFQKWLDTFAYKISLHGYIFILAGMIELGVALLCVGFIALRAALLNPALVLKDE